MVILAGLQVFDPEPDDRPSLPWNLVGNSLVKLSGAHCSRDFGGRVISNDF